MNTLRKSALHLASAALALCSPPGSAQTFTVPNTFVSGTPATAADVNANFSATAAAINGKQGLVTGSCPAGQSIRSISANGSVVCQPLSFFGGDGSAGNLTVGTQSWSASPPVNPNFANITINSGQTLTVPAGTTIRCSGSFTNAGILNVDPGAVSDGNFDALAGPSGPAVFLTSVAHPGDTPGAATLGEQNNVALANVQPVGGGTGGKAIPRAVAQTSFDRFRFGGGSGAGYDNQGNGGGGLVRIYCEGPITNTGTINAQGQNGGNSSIAGGGGGIVVLASRASVTNSGTINVVGGNGSAAGSWGGNGGGGGGGIVIMVAPTAPVLGTVNVSGGIGATGAATVTAGARTGGAGGGGSGGVGGDGGSVSSAT
ncbi:MAG TPA: hypothetical protein VFK92_11075, partial [Burkholderiales bacterium]|nr:hypothetical protein [Burkholderiales bacterium]